MQDFGSQHDLDQAIDAGYVDEDALIDQARVYRDGEDEQGPARRSRAPRRFNGKAALSLLLAFATVRAGMWTSVPAILLGHLALREIRATGQRGALTARWGLIFGYLFTLAALGGML